MTRLRQAVDEGQIRTVTDLDAVADALIGTLLFHALTRVSTGAKAQFDGLLGALLDGACQ
jgi:hypothetical protein